MEGQAALTFGEAPLYVTRCEGAELTLSCPCSSSTCLARFFSDVSRRAMRFSASARLSTPPAVLCGAGTGATSRWR